MKSHGNDTQNHEDIDIDISNLIKIRNRKVTEQVTEKQKIKRSERLLAQLSDDQGFLKRNVFFSFFNWAKIIIVIGARDYGKSFLSMRSWLSEHKKEKKRPSDQHAQRYWFRLSYTSAQKLLSNNAKKFIDPLLVKWFNLYDKRDEKGKITYKAIRRKGDDVYVDNRHFATVLDIATFYNNKGQALYDACKKGRVEITFDEFQREQSEKQTFDIVYNFVNQIENVARDNDNIRIWLFSNTLSDASEILTIFNFIPHDFGIFKLKKKKTVIINLPNTTQYLKRREKSIANILAPTESTFTNVRELRTSLVSKKQIQKPSYVIAFSSNDKYTVWDGNIIRPFKNEKVAVYPMRPFIKDYVYQKEQVDVIINLALQRFYKFCDLITQVKFDRAIGLLKNIK